jgi:hypothetical protein
MKNGTHEQSYFYLCCPYRSQHTCGSWMETGPPREPGGPMLTFAALMGALRYPSAPARGPVIDVCRIDGGRSRISVSILPGARRRRFLALMVGAPGSLAPALPRGAAVDVCYVDDGRSWISVSTSQGGRRRRFLTLMVDAPGSSAPTPPKGPAVDIS